MKQIFIISILFLLSFSVYSQQNILYTNDFAFNNEHWLFNSYSDTTNGHWSYITSLPQPLCGAASCYIPSINKILICGGINPAAIPQRTCYLYNPVNNSYSIADSLPTGRAFGKLLRVKDSLYLVGSVGSNFNFPDGVLYKYSTDSSKWQVRANLPPPFMHEMASCVWRDSLIVTVGGSTSGFSGVTGSIRIYNPSTNIWSALSPGNNIPIPLSTAHAEYMGNDLVVTGGYSYSASNKVFHTVYNPSVDTTIIWKEFGLSPFGLSAYRVAGGKWANYMLFGPAMHDTTAIPQIWGLNISDSTWRRFLPNIPDSVSNISSLSVRPLTDSAHFYIYGGILNNGVFTAISSKYSFANPYIGVSGNEEKILTGYKLYQNYPNPFNPATLINYDIPVSSYVSLKIFDVIGREISVLVNEYKKSGNYSIKFNAVSLTSGVYFCTIIAGDFKDTKKMLLIK